MFAKQNWYYALQSEELGSEVTGARIVEEDVVLYRDEAGRAHCLSAMCAHRGADLSLGRVVQGRIECPWHGWQYSGDGQCKLIPSIGACGKIPGLARVTSYPTVEQQGIVYVWMAPEVEPAWQPKLHPFLDAARQLRSPTRVQRGSYINTLEGAVDDSHVPFLHRNNIGRGAPRELPAITNLTIDEDNRGVEGSMIWPEEMKREASAFNAWLDRAVFGINEPLSTHDKTFRIETTGLVVHRYKKTNGTEFLVYAFVTPIDANNNRFMAAAADTGSGYGRLSQMMFRRVLNTLTGEVLDEDEYMIQSALTERFGGSHPRPVSVTADTLGLAYRRLYGNLVQAEGKEPAWPVSSKEQKQVVLASG